MGVVIYFNFLLSNMSMVGNLGNLNNNNCITVCPNGGSSVCAFDGVKYTTFPSECVYNMVNCVNNFKWEHTKLENCEKNNSDSNCKLDCSKTRDPVCGFDGSTYKIFNNQCLMNNENCADGIYWALKPLNKCSYLKPTTVEPEINSSTAKIKKIRVTTASPTIVSPTTARTIINPTTTFNRRTTIKPTISCEETKCSEDYNPVCGFNGISYKVFHNKCHMSNENCHNDWEKKPLTKCFELIPVSTTTSSSSGKDPMRQCEEVICPEDYDPVCVFDGSVYKTFDNPCLVNNDNCANERYWEKVSTTKCTQSASPIDPIEKCERHPCPKNYDPVCGFNGISYKVFHNKCHMNNENCHNDWEKKALTKCFELIPVSTTTSSPSGKDPMRQCEEVICPEDYDPVCVFDGSVYKTFDNPCLVNNDNCANEKYWEKVSTTKCTQSTSPIDPFEKCERHPCPKNYHPVCGFNGISYKIFGNNCLMNNENCHNDWKKKHISNCLQSMPTTTSTSSSITIVRTKQCEEITCPEDYDPVCAFDGISYKIFDSECHMNNENCDEMYWEKKTFLDCLANTLSGTSSSSTTISPASVPAKRPNTILNPIVQCEQVDCSEDYDPVCGYDGESYIIFDSECHMNNENCDEMYWEKKTFLDCLGNTPSGTSSTSTTISPATVAAKRPKTILNPIVQCEQVDCSQDYDPVCGFDGESYKIFDSDCHMNNENCGDGIYWDKKSFLKCLESTSSEISTTTMSTATATRPRFNSDRMVQCRQIPCTEDYDPVCGFDGISYNIFDSECHMNNENCDEIHWDKILFTECLHRGNKVRTTTEISTTTATTTTTSTTSTSNEQNTYCWNFSQIIMIESCVNNDDNK